jgi:hypothetical protein
MNPGQIMKLLMMPMMMMMIMMMMVIKIITDQFRERLFYINSEQY